MTGVAHLKIDLDGFNGAAAHRFPDSDQDQRPTFRPHPRPGQREVDGTVE